MRVTKGIQGMALAAAVLLTAGSALAQRGTSGARVQMDRPGMTATGSPLDGAERGSGVSGPSLGYLLDASTGDLHMVRGLAGSSVAGAAVHRKAPVRLAAISPSRDFAVVVDETDTVAFYTEGYSRGDAGLEVWNDAAPVTHAAVSPRGDRFALLAASTGRIALYTVTDGLPGEPRILQASLPLGSVARLAIADEGEAAFVIAAQGAGTGVSKVNADGSVRSLASLPAAVDLAFFAGGERALVLDAAQNTVYEVDFAAVNPSLHVVASQADGIDQPLAIALSGDGRSVAVVSAAIRRAVVMDLESRASQQVELAEAPTGIRRMNARGVFQVTDGTNAPALLLEVQPEGLRTVYVPRGDSGRTGGNRRASLD